MSPETPSLTGAIHFIKTIFAGHRNSNKKGIHYLDAGTSGGIWGLAEGYSLMVGGNEDVVERLRPIFETLAPALTGAGDVWTGGSGTLRQNDS